MGVKTKWAGFISVWQLPHQCDSGCRRVLQTRRLVRDGFTTGREIQTRSVNRRTGLRKLGGVESVAVEREINLKIAKQRLAAGASKRGTEVSAASHPSVRSRRDYIERHGEYYVDE